jgi:hypothetical protein
MSQIENIAAARPGHGTSVSTKILLIVSIFSLPIGVLAYLLAANYTPQIETAQVEMSGNAVQRPLMGAIYGLIKGKSLLESCNDATCLSGLADSGKYVRREFEAASRESASRAEELDITDAGLSKKHRPNLAVHNLLAEWHGLEAAGTTTSTPAERAALAGRYAGMIGELKQLVSYIGDSSTLILDPDLDSYYLVDVTLLAMPETLVRADNTAALANKLVAGDGSAVERAELANESALLEQDIARIAASNQTTFDADAANHGVSPTLVPKLRPALQKYQDTMNSYLATLKATAGDPSSVNPLALASQADTANRASLDYWNVAVGELDLLLRARIDDFQTSRAEALGLSGGVVLIAAFIAFMLGRSITKPLQSLVRNLGPGATLLASSVERIAETSQSATPDPEIASIICEELNAHAENMRKAVLELARQVEGGSAVREVREPTGVSPE